MYRVNLSKEDDTFLLVETKKLAMDYLWAYANKANYQYAEAKIDGIMFNNSDMKNTKGSALARGARDEMNREEIEEIVVEALNNQYQKLGAFGDMANLREIVAVSAASWINECYQ